MASFVSYLLDKLKFRRLALNPGVKLLTYGAIYSGTYSQWKHDRTPIIFIMYSDNRYTHAINTGYLNHSDKIWLGRLIYNIKNGAQNIDGRTLYKMIKMQRMGIITTAYRVYFTSLLDMKLVSAGITYLDNRTYSIKDQWINTLNEMIKPSELKNEYTPKGISYSSTELSDRITEAYNSVDITKSKVSPYGRAVWLK